MLRLFFSASCSYFLAKKKNQVIFQELLYRIPVHETVLSLAVLLYKDVPVMTGLKPQLIKKPEKIVSEIN